jgi:hypothetical protein
MFHVKSPRFTKSKLPKRATNPALIGFSAPAISLFMMAPAHVVFAVACGKGGSITSPAAVTNVS